MARQKLNIGLFGFGVVGQGLYEVLETSPALDSQVSRICVKRRVKRSLPDDMFCFEPDDILEDESINTIVELIDNADDAYFIVKKALKKGKNVVSANKKMIAENMSELVALAEENKVSLLYEASACGSIPIIRSLEEYYDNDLLLSVTGILNGSSNYILSKIFDNHESYADALRKAQELGFAESNPSFDVDGFDALYKLIILTMHSFGVVVSPDDVLNYGISNISDFDINYAREKGYKIKLVAQVERLRDKKIALFVLPRFVTRDKYIYNVEDEFNGVVIKGMAYEKQFMFGKGAGGQPTGSAVLSDITALGHYYRYEYKKANYFGGFHYFKEGAIEVYLRYSNPDVLKHFDFKSVSEEYHGPEHHYRIGFMRLDKLIAIKEKLRTLDVFLAATGKALNY